MRRIFLSVIVITIISSCKKSVDKSSFPILRAYVGVSINAQDTVQQNLSSIGHIHTPKILQNPHYADYSKIKLNSTNQPIYYYHPKEIFTGNDSIVFRSVEPTEKIIIISTYYFSIH